MTWPLCRYPKGPLHLTVHRQKAEEYLGILLQGQDTTLHTRANVELEGIARQSVEASRLGSCACFGVKLYFFLSRNLP